MLDPESSVTTNVTWGTCQQNSWQLSFKKKFKNLKWKLKLHSKIFFFLSFSGVKILIIVCVFLWDDPNKIMWSKITKPWYTASKEFLSRVVSLLPLYAAWTKWSTGSLILIFPKECNSDNDVHILWWPYSSTQHECKANVHVGNSFVLCSN